MEEVTSEGFRPVCFNSVHLHLALLPGLRLQSWSRHRPHPHGGTEAQDVPAQGQGKAGVPVGGNDRLCPGGGQGKTEHGGFPTKDAGPLSHCPGGLSSVSWWGEASGCCRHPHDPFGESGVSLQHGPVAFPQTSHDRQLPVRPQGGLGNQGRDTPEHPSASRRWGWWVVP